jgi:outer membrane protein
MLVRQGWVLGLAVACMVAPAFGQTLSGGPSDPKPPAKRVTVAQTTTASGVSRQTGIPRTLAEALAATYANQPALQAERAKLRATDENVPQALSGWRPTVTMAGTLGYGDGMSRQFVGGSGHWLKSQTDRQIGTARAVLSQPLYTGGKTQGNINRSKNQVMAERANLIGQEQTSFLNVVAAYVGSASQIGVIEAQQLLALALNNEQVLAKQLPATNDRFDTP